MSEIEIVEIKRKSARGVIALIQRTFLIQIIGIVSTGLFGVFLSQQQWGIFGLVNSIIAFLTYFSDIGLAGALIQKKEQLSHDDLSTTFTIQQILVGIIVIVGLIGSGSVGSFYKLDEAGIWLFRALLFSLLLSSLKTIPSIILERHLDFHKMVIPQIIETVAFNVIAVFLAWRGYGVWSFTWGVIARAVLGLIAMYSIAPWKISIGINSTVAKRLFHYGIPFQSNSFLALLKDDLMILFLGKILPLGALGYISFAKRASELPLRTIMDNVLRVTFPAFSRLQHDSSVLKKALEKTIFGIACSVFPLYVGMIFFIQPFITIIPKYQKWEPAILSFYFFCITSIMASLSTPLTNALNAVGKIKITLYFMIGWVVSTWIFVLIFIHLFGFDGFSLALMFIATMSIFVVVYVVKQVIPFSFWGNIRSPLLAIVPQIFFYVLFLPRIPHSLPFLIITGAAGVLIYGGVLWGLERKRILELVSAFRYRN